MNADNKMNIQLADRIAKGNKLYYANAKLKKQKKNNKLNSVALVREQTIPTERPPPVGEVSANFCG